MKTGDTFTSTKLPIAIYINNCDLSVKYAEKVTFTLKSSTPAPVVIKPNCVNECSNHNQRYCVDNKVYSCYVVDGCWIESLVDTCPNNEFWNCVNDRCVQQVPLGCKYGNPACESGYKCDEANNKCVKDEGVCYQECSSLDQKWCVGNIAMGCYKVNNCLKGRQIEICSNDKPCVQGKCVSKKELGCVYHNPDCDSGYECKNNE